MDSDVPEILLAVSFLSTRVKSASEQDWKKLNRVLMYMNNPETLLGIRFGSDKKVNGIELDTYVDVSFAVHRDMRSHTGGVVRIFSGPADVESSKQKINTKSTAESELVGLSDFSGACIHQRQYLVA